MRELPGWHSLPLALHLLCRRGRACLSSLGHCLCHLQKYEPSRLGWWLPGLDAQVPVGMKLLRGPTPALTPRVLDR